MNIHSIIMVRKWDIEYYEALKYNFRKGDMERVYKDKREYLRDYRKVLQSLRKAENGLKNFYEQHLEELV